MTTLALRPRIDAELFLDAEHAAAVARLDADLAIAATAAGGAHGVHRLRRHAVAAYRNALGFAAGEPADPRWHQLSLAVAAFIARIAGNPRSTDAAAAVARLRLLLVSP